MAIKEYTDSDGFTWVVQVPDGEKNLARGMVLGPPELDKLGLTKAKQKKVQSLMVRAGIYNAKTLLGRRKALRDILAECKLDKAIEYMIINLLQRVYMEG